jgi:branched-chain amino acid transport system ATP-binding protein
MLKCISLSKKFGKLLALNNINLTINDNEIVGLIGPNGSGKTTLINCVTGLLKPSSGEIIFRGKNINGLSPHKICRMGISRTFQTPRLFKRLSVLENVLVAAGGDESYALQILEWVGLLNLKDVETGRLNFLQIRLLELARALASNPKIVFIDEIVAGLTPDEIEKFIELLKDIKAKGITIVWVEHVLKAMIDVVERMFVLNEGNLIAEGKPSDVLEREEVITAYLGQRIIKK